MNVIHKNNGLVSIVILNWNGLAFIKQCIESVLLQEYSKYEIIVVDNGSTDESINIVKENYPTITVIQNEKNLGFAQGMNIGIQASSGEYLLLLNEDAYLERNFILTGVLEFETDPKIGWAGGVVREMTSTKRCETVINTAFALRGRFQLKSIGTVHDRERSLIASPCAMLLRREALIDSAFESHNWLDSNYFAYWEDTDLGLRMLLRGWKCIYNPDMCVWHFVSGSVSGKQSLVDKPKRFRRMALRNRHSTIIKDVPSAVLIPLIPKLLFIEVLIIIYYAVFSFSTLICNFQAIGDTILNSRKLFRQRAIIQSRTQISPLEFKKFIQGVL